MIKPYLQALGLPTAVGRSAVGLLEMLFAAMVCRSRGRRWYPENYYIFVLLCALPIPGILQTLAGWLAKQKGPQHF